MYIVYFTDPHLTPSRPRARKDDYGETVLNKLIEVVDKTNALMEVTGKDAVLVCGGDLFHQPVVPVSYMRNVVRILKRLKYPMLIAAGNHDFFGYNADTVHRTMLGLLEATGLVELLSDDTPVRYLDKDSKKEVWITGVGYHAEVDKDASAYNVEKPKDNPRDTVLIHVVHGYLVNYPIDYVGHTYLKDVKTDADFVLTGHEHIGFGVVRHGGCTFCNPGAAARVNAAIKEIDRMPQYALIDTATMEIGLYNFDCAKEGKKVLDRGEIEKAVIQKAKIEEFSKSIEKTIEDEEVDLENCVEHINRLEKVPKKVRDLATQYISTAQERILRGDM